MAIQRTIRVTTTQDILKNEPKVQDFPMRKWSIQVSVLGPNGEELPANVFDKVTYKLHPTFVNPNRTFKTPPFKLEEKGWGEFDVYIVCHFAERGGEQTLTHDLNFRQPKYEVDHTMNFPSNKPGLLRLLSESGPVPEKKVAPPKAVSSIEETPIAGAKRKQVGPAENGTGIKKKAKIEKGSVDLEKLAEGLKLLTEDDLFQVVQMVTDNLTPEMYIKNDVKEGEFHMDLFTLPDSLLKSLWEFVKQRVTI